MLGYSLFGFDTIVVYNDYREEPVKVNYGTKLFGTDEIYDVIDVNTDGTTVQYDTDVKTILTQNPFGSVKDR